MFANVFKKRKHKYFVKKIPFSMHKLILKYLAFLLATKICTSTPISLLFIAWKENAEIGDNAHLIRNHSKRTEQKQNFCKNAIGAKHTSQQHYE